MININVLNENTHSSTVLFTRNYILPQNAQNTENKNSLSLSLSLGDKHNLDIEMKFSRNYKDFSYTKKIKEFHVQSSIECPVGKNYGSGELCDCSLFALNTGPDNTIENYFLDIFYHFSKVNTILCTVQISKQE